MNRSLAITSMMLVAVLLSYFCVAPTHAQPVHWNQMELSPRCGHTLIYDSARNVAVLFGGSTGTTSAETWEWTGSQWRQRLVAGPSRRYQHAMAFDSIRGVGVLFGGIESGSGYMPLQETWEWNGSTWTRRTIEGPFGRFRHAMAFDSARGVTVLFGGLVPGRREDDETWEWNGSLWLRRNLPGPSRRGGHAMAFDPIRGVTVLFGGATANGTTVGTDSNETWEFDGNAWTQRLVAGPSPRSFHSMMYNVNRGKIVLFGGAAGYGSDTPVFNNEAWEWSGTEWTQIPNSAPSARCGEAMCITAAGTALAYGGISATGFIGETWELNGTSWILRGISGPSTRDGPAMVYDPLHRVTTLFGGSHADSFPFHDVSSDETWDWNGLTWTRRDVLTRPSPRALHVMAFDSARGKVVLFGGSDITASSTTFNSETWEWNGVVWNRRSLGGPSARDFAAMSYDSERQRMVLFGGRVAGNSFMGDTWEWNGSGWQRVSIVGPSIRMGHAMAYDTLRHKTVLFGGHGSADSNETWEWDGSVWTQRPVVGPSPRYLHMMAYDEARHRTVLLGGMTNSTWSDEMWEWDGSIWTRQTVPGPSARMNCGMAYDSARRAMVLFGGDVLGSRSAETWELNLECTGPTISQPPQDRVACRHGLADMSLENLGTQPVTYQWQHELTPGSNGWIDLTDSHVLSVGMVSGSTTRTLHITAFEELAHGAYRCIVNNPCGTVMSHAANLAICATDFNCDNIVDLFDYLDFIAALADDLPAADFNGDGVTDFFDYLDFVDAFSTGC